MKIQLFPYFWYFGCLKASFPVFRHNLEVRPRPESCPKPGILKFPLNRKKIMFLAMCSWLHSKDTLPVPPASEKYLLPWVRLVKIRDFFSWINHKRSLDLKQQFLETEKFYLLSCYETLDIRVSCHEQDLPIGFHHLIPHLIYFTLINIDW